MLTFFLWGSLRVKELSRTASSTDERLLHVSQITLTLWYLGHQKQENLLYCSEPGPSLLSALKHGDKSAIISQKSTESDMRDPKSILGFGLEKLDAKALVKEKIKWSFVLRTSPYEWSGGRNKGTAKHMELGDFLFVLFLYSTILFNNFSVKYMVNILALAYNHDRSKETLKKRIYCHWPSCKTRIFMAVGLLAMLLWASRLFVSVWELGKRKYIMDLFMWKTQTTQSKKQPCIHSRV